MDSKLTWRDVLDCSKTWHGVITNAKNVAKQVGYQYFAFNDRIYAITVDGYYDTGLLIDCLK